MRFALLLLVLALPSQAAAAELNIILMLRAGGVRDPVHDKDRPETGKWPASFKLTFDCDQDVATCASSKFDVKAGEVAVEPTNKIDGPKRAFVVDTTKTPNAHFTVIWQDKPLVDETLTAAPQQTKVVADQPEPETSISAFLATSCSAAIGEAKFAHYDEGPNKSTYVVISPVGDMISNSVLQNVNEEDTVTIVLVADATLLPYISVVRTSPLRTPGQLSILGADMKIPSLVKEVGGPPACDAKQFTFKDFAPGAAKIEIRAYSTKGIVVLGQTEFTVNRLYSGMFTLGPIWTGAVDPGFTTVSNGTNTVVSSQEKGSTRMLYALFYTPFIWGKRDIEQPLPKWYHHVNPSLGLVLNSITDNVLGGLSADFINGFVVTGGAHLAHVSVIDSQSGLSEGSVYTGDPAKLPVSKQWVVKPFISVSVDLRAAVQLLKTAVTSSTQ